MKFNIKNLLIHLLGGVTKAEAKRNMSEELCDIVKEAVQVGRLVGLELIKAKADRIAGLNADEWCKVIYGELEKRIAYPTDEGFEFDIDDDYNITMTYTEEKFLNIENTEDDGKTE